MKPLCEVWFGGMPVPKEFCSKLRDDALVSSDSTIRLEEFIQSEKRGGTI